MAKFGVIGSINMDLVASVYHFPEAGETVMGRSFNTFPGGKGANQAIALARLGASVEMAGKIGDDDFADRYRAVFRQESVDDAQVRSEAATSTGITVIEVDEAGENRIVLIAGANAACSPDYLDEVLRQAGAWEIVLLQLEIPLETTVHAARRLKELGKSVILDPAPAQTLPRELLQSVDIITPNEHEAAVLLSERNSSAAPADAATAADKLTRLGAATVIVKLGGAGALLKHGGGETSVPGFSVDVVDTTAAGDAFNAGLAFALGDGAGIEEAVRFANAVGALSCTAAGAQSAFPSRREALQMTERGRR